MVPAQTTTISLARIKTIVDDFNRIYGRANVQLIIGLNQQLNLEAFVYKFHQLEFENVDLANFNPLTIVAATLEQAKAGIRRIKATRSAHATSPQLMKTPYAEAAAFLSWLADARRVACTRVGQFEQTIDYLLDPNNSAPRGSKFDQDNTELFNILAPSFMNSSDPTMTRLILPYQASSDGLALFKHVLELNQGEAGLNRALDELRKFTVNCPYTGTSKQVSAVTYCQNWENYRLFFEHEGNILIESELIKMFYNKIEVSTAHIKFWGEFGQSRSAVGATFATFLRKFQSLVVFYEVERDAGATASYRTAAAVTPSKGTIPGIPTASEGSDIPGIPGGSQGGALTEDEMAKLLSELPSHLKNPNGKINTANFNWTELNQARPDLAQAIRENNKRRRTELDAAFQARKRKRGDEDADEKALKRFVQMVKDYGREDEESPDTKPSPKGARTGTGIGG